MDILILAKASSFSGSSQICRNLQLPVPNSQSEGAFPSDYLQVVSLFIRLVMLDSSFCARLMQVPHVGILLLCGSVCIGPQVWRSAYNHHVDTQPSTPSV